MFPPPGPGPSGCSKPGEGVSEVSSNSLGSGTGGHGEGGGCCHLRGQDLRVALLGQLSCRMFWELTWEQGPGAAHLRGTEPSGRCGCGHGGVGLGLPVLSCPQIHTQRHRDAREPCLWPWGDRPRGPPPFSVVVLQRHFAPGGFSPWGAEWSLGDGLATSQLFTGNLQTAKKTKVFTSLFKAPTPLQVALRCQAGLVALGVAWPLAWRLAHRLL